MLLACIVEVFTQQGDALADGDAIEWAIGDEVAATAVVEGTGSS